jgi:hypothetical protein
MFARSSFGVSPDRNRCEDGGRAPIRGDCLRQQPLGRLRASPRRHHHRCATEVRDDMDADDLRAAHPPGTGANAPIGHAFAVDRHGDPGPHGGVRGSASPVAPPVHQDPHAARRDTQRSDRQVASGATSSTTPTSPGTQPACGLSPPTSSSTGCTATRSPRSRSAVSPALPTVSPQGRESPQPLTAQMRLIAAWGTRATRIGRESGSGPSVLPACPVMQPVEPAETGSPCFKRQSAAGQVDVRGCGSPSPDGPGALRRSTGFQLALLTVV